MKNPIIDYIYIHNILQLDLKLTIKFWPPLWLQK